MFKIDMHVHSNFSYDSKEDIANYIDKAKEMGIDGICLTEHDRYELNPDEQKVYNFAKWYANREGIFLARNVEVSTEYGHILVYGMPDKMGSIDKCIKDFKKRLVFTFRKIKVVSN